MCCDDDDEVVCGLGVGVCGMDGRWEGGEEEMVSDGVDWGGGARAEQSREERRGGGGEMEGVIAMEERGVCVLVLVWHLAAMVVVMRWRAWSRCWAAAAAAGWVRSCCRCIRSGRYLGKVPTCLGWCCCGGALDLWWCRWCSLVFFCPAKVR